MLAQANIESYLCDDPTGPVYIGFVKALQILYHGMLRKTSASSYPNYRLWTVQAAHNLFKDNCYTVTAVKLAWSAQRVPDQPGEPACFPSHVVDPMPTDVQAR